MKFGLIRSLTVKCSPGMCLAGPIGDGFRSLLNKGALKVGEVRGTSTFDVMTKYWELQGWGEYKMRFQQDREPYPEEWVTIQRNYLNRD